MLLHIQIPSHLYILDTIVYRSYRKRTPRGFCVGQHHICHLCKSLPLKLQYHE